MDATKKLDFFYLSRFYPLCLYATVAMKLLVKETLGRLRYSLIVACDFNQPIKIAAAQEWVERTLPYYQWF